MALIEVWFKDKGCAVLRACRLHLLLGPTTVDWLNVIILPRNWFGDFFPPVVSALGVPRTHFLTLFSRVRLNQKLCLHPIVVVECGKRGRVCACCRYR